MKRATLLLCLFATPTLAGEATFEGNISATLSRAGTQPTHLVFTRKGDQLRIENTDNKLEPINILDLQAKTLTIVYPHNTTFVKVDLAALAARADGGRSGVSIPPPLPPTPGSGPGSATAPRVAPSISPPPGFPSPPPMPSMPGMPSPGPGGPGMTSNPGMPAMPGAGLPGMPGAPMMPAMMNMGAPELKKTEEAKEIQGLDCVLYSGDGRGEKLEVWAAGDSDLFPFRLIERDFLGRHFGPRMLEETWPELLRERSLFPLEATLKMEPGSQERLSFKVEKIERKKIDDPKLFQPPENYIQIESPQF